MRKKILITISLFLIIGISVYLYSYKGHRDIESETADYVVTVHGLEKEFTSNDSLAYLKYQDKTIELTAQVTTIDTASNGIVMGEKIFATFKDPLPKDITSGKMLKIKGRFLGYDELLQEFKIDQSSVVH
ncbi:hypothetical protein D0809_21445 [Flavobacterium circumlabens]|uniref:tRNA_anti-like n=1 Tax=Flavobacterium circumlabens TaxID=2133765 RepID=A0A4Y7U6T0_9FLAO|nr:hypothetical protein [Flavobacterium circumlabens]TCN61267.1 hypothetical protein EV142_101855 [Flavobacterium circumlabens]TEB42140.1 hypothetical protein D0809_21445 [Flavobacterium circumlabens]